MFVSRQDVRRVSGPVFLISALAWFALLIRPELMHAHVHHWRQLLNLRSVVALVPSWLLMLAAMMAPVLIAPICWVRSRSFVHRRNRSVALFVVGYAAVWTIAAPLLLAVEVTLRTLSPNPYSEIVLLVLAAVVWQCSPLRQICLNRCHGHADLAAFGMAADLSAVRFGFTHGFWCVGSCWALMLLPLMPQAHMPAMLIVTMVVFSDRLARPALPAWRWPGWVKT